MKYVQTFESYLQGGRQLLYHSSLLARKIMQSDKLLLGKPVDDTGPAICVTRSLTFRHGCYRFALDAEALRLDGYHAYPVCELGGIIVRKKLKNTAIKSNIEQFRKGVRGVANNIEGLPKRFKLEYEYEERFYEEITNLGKYVVYIDILRGGSVENIPLKSYLEIYPHIQVRIEGDKYYKLTTLSKKELDVILYRKKDTVKI